MDHGTDNPPHDPVVYSRPHDPWINTDSALIYNPFKNKIVIQPITIFKWRYPYNFKSIFHHNFFIICRVLLENRSKDRLSCLRRVSQRKLPCLISCPCPEVQFHIQHNYCLRSFYIWKIKIIFFLEFIDWDFKSELDFHQNFWFKRKSH